jgi:transposase
MKWRWIYHNNGQKLYDVAVLSDGSLHNPNGYDEAMVREAIRQAEEQERASRSRAAKKAAITRQRRREKRIYEVAKQIIGNRIYGPRGNCVICGKGLGDKESIARGIGSECWQRILESMTAQQSAFESYQAAQN